MLHTTRRTIGSVILHLSRALEYLGRSLLPDSPRDTQDEFDDDCMVPVQDPLTQEAASMLATRPNRIMPAIPEPLAGSVEARLAKARRI